jgi:hypothetical protein
LSPALKWGGRRSGGGSAPARRLVRAAEYKVEYSGMISANSPPLLRWAQPCGSPGRAVGLVYRVYRVSTLRRGTPRTWQICHMRPAIRLLAPSGKLRSDPKVTDVGEIIDALHRSGWTVGDAAFVGRTAERVWVVTGANGENRIRAAGLTELEAWQGALDQARALGMLGRGGESTTVAGTGIMGWCEAGRSAELRC